MSDLMVIMRVGLQFMFSIAFSISALRGLQLLFPDGFVGALEVVGLSFLAIFFGVIGFALQWWIWTRGFQPDEDQPDE